MVKDSRLILVLDVGTSSLRATLFDETGMIHGKVQETYAVQAKGTDTVEMDMSLFRSVLLSVLGRTGKLLGKLAGRICCIAVTAQRSSVIPVDENGKALATAMMWQDTRSLPICTAVAEQAEELYQICGMRPLPMYSAPKIAYLKRTNPRLYARAYKCIGFSEYVLYALSGVFATDVSIASRTCLFNICTLQWSSTALSVFDLDVEKLCPIVPVGSIIGTITVEVKNLLGVRYDVPVLSAGGDQQCACLGYGCTESLDMMVNCGTGSYAIALSDTPVFDASMRTCCNVASVPGKWIVESSTLSSGKTLNWLNDNFFATSEENHPFENFTVASRRAPRGCNGLRFAPTLAGKGTPLWDFSARGSITNINFCTTKDDFARSVLEGIGMEIADCLDVLEELMVVDLSAVQVSGGLCSDVFFVQMLADMFGKQVIRKKGMEATSLGAWIVACVSSGFFHDHAQAYKQASSHWQEEIFKPEPTGILQYEEIRRNLLKTT
jgi:sugar (pentulose or hexulose) kinase